MGLLHRLAEAQQEDEHNWNRTAEAPLHGNRVD